MTSTVDPTNITTMTATMDPTNITTMTATMDPTNITTMTATMDPTNISSMTPTVELDNITAMIPTIDFSSVSISDVTGNAIDDSEAYAAYYGDYYEEHTYDTFMYPGYPFERTLYVYIWGILVLIMFLANIIVIFVLLQKKMRNPTNIILVCIAISDSLTGLVTLPAYWATYNQFEPAGDYEFTTIAPDLYDTSTYSSDLNSTVESYLSSTPPMHTEGGSQEVYILSKSLCNYFMITKYFVSKTFHTVSIWLTLFLGFQRFISVAAPFRAQTMFTKEKTIIICLVIGAAAPLLHIYHLLDNKAEDNKGMCEWDVEDPCEGTCAYLVIAFVLRHFLPCVLLIISTILFVIHLTRSTSRINQVDCNQGNKAMHQRDSENRRVSFIVIAIVIVFLIPEVPYGCFLLYALIGKLTDTSFDLETNRAIHLTYEVSLVVSFHLNFYIYTFFNKRFRRTLIRVFYPCLSLCGYHKKMTTDSHSSFTSRRRTAGNSDTCTRLEMVNMVGPQSSGTHQSLTLERKNVNGNGHLAGDEATEQIALMQKS